jgi:hypothetical protein
MFSFLTFGPLTNIEPNLTVERMASEDCYIFEQLFSKKNRNPLGDPDFTSVSEL